MKVLHIEDRAENRLLVRKVLEARGHTVVDCADGLTGLELARSAAPDLVLLDINIPGLDGYEVVSRLKDETRLATIPVVAITAEGDRDRALALGFDGFLSKPIRMATFEKELLAFAAGHREAGDDSRRQAHLLDHGRRVVDRLEAKVRELTRANERLREVDRLKMEVLRNVSHELATPLTPLTGYVKMLGGQELGPLTEAQRTVVSRLDGSVGRLRELIDNLLNVTRFATGSVSLEHSVLGPAEVIEQAVAAMQRRAEARQVKLRTRLGTLEPVVGDRVRLLDALKQLIDNAIKFGPAGGTVTVEAAVVVQAGADARQLELAVLDEGPGIAPAQRDRVVEPFYQIDGSATRSAGGAGLGLAVVARTADLHEGLLVIEDAPGGGARVVLRLPTRHH